MAPYALGRGTWASLVCLLYWISAALSQCSDNQDFAIVYDGAPFFSVSRANATCVCNRFQATSTGSPSALSGGLLVSGTATFTGSVSVAGGQTVNIATTAPAGAVNIGASGVLSTLRVWGPATFGSVTAASFAGDGSAITNLNSQPEFAALKAQVTVLNTINGQPKNCTVGSVITKINADGTVQCTAIAFINGVPGASCITNSDCISPSACVSNHCVGQSGSACTRDVECAAGLLCSLSVCAAPTATSMVANPSFENGASGSCGLSVSPGYLSGTIQSWAFASGGVNLQGSGGCPFAVGTNSGYGSYVAFGQLSSSVSQAVSGFQIGRKYRLSAYLSFRIGTSSNLNVQFQVDSSVVFGPVNLGSGYTSASPYTKATSNVFTATATTHTIAVVGVPPSSPPDASFLVDNVVIERY